MIPTFSPKNIYIFLHNEKKNPKAAKYIEIQNFEDQSLRNEQCSYSSEIT